jgi:hypothetical protein
MPEEEMIKLPKQFEDPAFRFIKIDSKPDLSVDTRGKKPLESAWQTESNYPSNSRKLKKWLGEGNNYGVATGYGNLLIIDADHVYTATLIKENLPETFTVKSGGFYSNGQRKNHFYYYCSDFLRKIPLDDDPEGNHYGELQWKGAQVIGPGSLHYKTGNHYEVANDVPIATVTREQVLAVLKPCLKETALRETVERAEGNTPCTLDITKVADMRTLKQSRKNPDLFKGVHPVHGATCGGNFCVDIAKGYWYCFRHGTGGNTLSLVAVKEGLIQCQDCKPGTKKFHEDVYLKVKKAGLEKYGLLKEAFECAENSILRLMDSPEDLERNKVLFGLAGSLPNTEDTFAVFFITKGVFTHPVVSINGVELVQVNSRLKEHLENIEVFERQTLERKEDPSKSAPKTPKYLKPADIPDEERYYYFERNNITYRFSQKLDFSGKIEGVNTVNNDVVRLYHVQKEEVTSDIFDRFIGKFNDYYFNPSEYENVVLGSFAVHTYLFKLLGRVFYIAFVGLETTGKSVALKTLALLCKNGHFGGKGTIPYSVRLIAFCGVTLLQDEFEKMQKEDKVTFIGVMNTGFNEGGTYGFVNTNKKNVADQLETLATFGPKAFTANDLYGFDTSFLSRTYPVVSIKSGKHLKNIDSLSSAERKEFQDLRNQMFIYTLRHSKEMVTSIEKYKNLLESENKYGRETDKNSIILGIVAHFKGDDYALKVKEYIEKKAPLEALEKQVSKQEAIVECVCKVFLDQEITVVKYMNTSLWRDANLLLDCNVHQEDGKKEAEPIIRLKEIRTILTNLGLISENSDLNHTHGKLSYILRLRPLIGFLERNVANTKYNELFSQLKLKKNFSEFFSNTLGIITNHTNPPNPTTSSATEENEKVGLVGLDRVGGLPAVLVSSSTKSFETENVTMDELNTQISQTKIPEGHIEIQGSPGNFIPKDEKTDHVESKLKQKMCKNHVTGECTNEALACKTCNMFWNVTKKRSEKP